MNELTNEQMNEWMKEWKNVWMNEWMNKRMNEWMNEQSLIVLQIILKWDDVWLQFYRVPSGTALSYRGLWNIAVGYKGQMHYAFFKHLVQNICCKLLLDSSCLQQPACMSIWNNTAPTLWLVVKFYVRISAEIYMLYSVLVKI
jgi:hypothetical protein